MHVLQISTKSVVVTKNMKHKLYSWSKTFISGSKCRLWRTTNSFHPSQVQLNTSTSRTTKKKHFHKCISKETDLRPISQTKHPSFSSLLFTKTFHFKFMLGALTLFLNYMHALLNIVVHTLMGGGGARTKGIHISDYKWGAFLYLCALQDFSSLCLILVFSQSHFPFTSSWSRVRPKPKSVHCCCT